MRLSCRYCGFYRKKHENHDKMVMLVDKAKHSIRKTFMKHRLSILKAFNTDPFSCPKCNIKMIYVCDILRGG